jgi:hypothetical protein
MQLRRHTILAVLGLSLLAVGCKNGSTGPDGPVVPTLPQVPAGSILLYDKFDNENGGAGVNNWTTFTNWNVVDGCVDLHGNGFWDVQAGHGLYVDMDGSCYAAGTIESKEEFALVPGTYVLEFWIAGNQRNDSPDTTTVTLGSLFNEQFVTERYEQFRLVTRRVDVGAATAARLRFRGHGGDQQGMLLDEVRLRRAG